MTHGLRPRLSIPTLLAVSALGIVAGCPSDDDGDTGNESGPAMTTTSGEGSTTGEEPATTTSATAATETTAADSGSSGAIETDTEIDVLPECQNTADQADCEDTLSCVWMPELGGCIIDCTIVPDEATCMEQLGCAWYGDFCDFEPLA